MIGGFSVKAPNRYQTQSNDSMSCYGNSMERTNEIANRIRTPAWSYYLSLIVDRVLSLIHI